MAYDRDSTGWEFPGLGPRDARPRPAAERVRCGPYTAPDGETMWGDHRVTIPGSTCTQVECHVEHHPDIFPGWAEPIEDYYKRPGVGAIATAFWGWDAGGMLRQRLGDSSAWVAAHVALDALRDAGYTVTPPEPKT